MYSHSDYYRAYHTAAAAAEHIPVHGGIAVYVKAPGQTDFRTRTLSGVVVNKTTGHKYLLGQVNTFFPTVTSNNILIPGGTNIGNPLFQAGNPNTPIGTTSHKPNPTQYKLFPVETPNSDTAMLSAIPDWCGGVLAIPSVAVSFDCLGIGKQGPMIPPKMGMKVKMYGSVSGLQRGKITLFNYSPTRSAVSDVSIPAGQKYIEKNKIQAEMLAVREDAGALVVTDDSKNNVVGIVDGVISAPSGKPAVSISPADIISSTYGVYFSEAEYKGPAPVGSPPIPTPGPGPTPTPTPGDGTTPTPTPTGDIGSILRGTVQIGTYSIPVWMLGLGGAFGMAALVILSGVGKR